MVFSEAKTLRARHLEERALHVALLAFRCARHHGERRDTACAVALKAYLAISPTDVDASDKVVKAIAEAVQRHPHWLAPEPVSEAGAFSE